MKTYQYLRVNSNTYIFIHYRDHMIKLEYECSQVSNTYMGLFTKAYIDTMRIFTKEFPALFECIEPIEVLKFLKQNNFKLTELSAWQTVSHA